MRKIAKIAKGLYKLAEETICIVTFKDPAGGSKPITVHIPYNREPVSKLIEMAKAKAGQDSIQVGEVLVVQLDYGKTLYDVEDQKKPAEDTSNRVNKVYFAHTSKPGSSIAIPVSWQMGLVATDYIPLALKKAKDMKVDMKLIGNVLGIKDYNGNIIFNAIHHIK